MKFFQVIDNQISGSKILNIGAETFVTIGFDFTGSEFSDNDVFQLTINSEYVNDNYSFINAGKLKFVNVPLDFLQEQITDVSLVITRNGNSILSDSISVITTAGDYYTKQETENLVKSNQLGINTSDNSSDTIAIAYNPEIAIQKVNLTSNNASLTINPCTGYIAESGKVPTFELWISPATTKTTISISNSIQVIGDMPDQLTAGNVYCYTFRFVGSKQMLNFSHYYSLESSSSSAE